MFSVACRTGVVKIGAYPVIATEGARLVRQRNRRWLARSLTVAGAIGCLLGTAFAANGVSYHFVRRLPVPDLPVLVHPPAAPQLIARSLSPELRRRGYGECNPYDFVGLGPYSPYRKLRVGRIAIPQKGGHTANWGYDVLVHFHGHTALRMMLAQVARGVSFVGIDLGNGSGAYSDAFQAPESWPLLRESIENALRAHSGRPEAHIRHVALTAWSAGYGAVNEILKYHADDIDAVILLDALHAAWDPMSGSGGRRKVVAGPVEPTVEFARQALADDKIFVFTHSEVDPVTYPSTSRTAAFLLDELGLDEQAANSTSDPFGLLGAVDIGGVHVWSYRGNDKPAHCAQLAHIDRAVRDVLEPAWNTPAMDRNVPLTPAPKLGPENADDNDDAISTPQARRGRDAARAHVTSG